MRIEDLKPKAGFFEQLALGLELDAEAAQGRLVTPDEARRRSEAAKRALEATGRKVDHPGWYGQYQHLLDEGWPWRVACYIAWAASPKRDRWPETQAELATEILGLTSPRQIHTWRKKYPEIDEVISVLQAAPMLERRADAIAALVESASNPDHRSNPDRRLYFEMTGDYIPRQKVEVRRDEVEDLSELSEEELARMARSLRGKETIEEDTSPPSKEEE